MNEFVVLHCTLALLGAIGLVVILRYLWHGFQLQEEAEQAFLGEDKSSPDDVVYIDCDGQPIRVVRKWEDSLDVWGERWFERS